MMCKYMAMLLCLCVCSILACADIPGNDFNTYVMNTLASYPTDGTHQYYWPTSGTWAGNTQDMYYRDSLFATGDPYKRCYCCGITFEVFFFAYKQYCKNHGWDFIVSNMTNAQLLNFRRLWFGSDGNRRTLQNAIVTAQIGRAIDINSAQAGDFVQFWRTNGSGHSVIFIAWTYNSNGVRNGLKYWSTQSSTNGIGYRTEYFDVRGGIDPDQIYIARIGKQ